MPYIYAQAKQCSAAGHPMLRPLFFEFPDDPGSWLIEDQYLFGRDLLVAPMVTAGKTRNVYLPPGGWVDFQTDERYDGGRWHEIAPGEIPIVLLVRAGAKIPMIDVAQSTAEMDLDAAEYREFGQNRPRNVAR